MRRRNATHIWETDDKNLISEIWCFDQIMTGEQFIELLHELTNRIVKTGFYLSRVDIDDLGVDDKGLKINNLLKNKCRVWYRKLPSDLCQQLKS